jgi:hypothetical protein
VLIEENAKLKKDLSLQIEQQRLMNEIKGLMQKVQGFDKQAREEL